MALWYSIKHLGQQFYIIRSLLKYWLIFLGVWQVSYRKDEKKYQEVFQKNAHDNIIIVKLKNLTPRVNILESKSNRKN